MINLTVIILTLNEERNIGQSLSNVCNWAKYVYVLDSYSNDKTCDIALEYGADIFYRDFDTYGGQRSYAINDLPIKTEWVLFLDADEFLLDDLKVEISEAINLNTYDGYYLKRRFYFMGKWIKHGGYYPTWILRLFKREKSTCDRDINEHVVVDGNVGYLKHDFVDNNQKSIADWVEKHNKYAAFEAMELVKNKDHSSSDKVENLFGSQVERKRWIVNNIWERFLPPLVRPFIYYVYRYFFRLGILDGIPGLVFHLFHGLFYRLLIDVKYLELTKNKK